MRGCSLAFIRSELQPTPPSEDEVFFADPVRYMDEWYATRPQHERERESDAEALYAAQHGYRELRYGSGRRRALPDAFVLFEPMELTLRSWLAQHGFRRHAALFHTWTPVDSRHGNYLFVFVRN